MITRPQGAAADATAARVHAMGFSPVAAPALRITGVATGLPPLESVQAVLVTSGNALPELPAAYRARPLLAVGAATARRAAALGYGDVTSADGDAAALLNLCLRCCTPAAGTLLVATGRGQGAALAAELSQAGFSVQRREVYAAHPMPALPNAALVAWRGEALHACLFFSAETARAFVQLAQQAGGEHARGVEALAIGAAGAVALSPLKWRAVRVADKPTEDAVLALLT